MTIVSSPFSFLVAGLSDWFKSLHTKPTTQVERAEAKQQRRAYRGLIDQTLAELETTLPKSARAGLKIDL